MSDAPPIGCEVTEMIPHNAGPDYYQRRGVVWAVIYEPIPDEPEFDVDPPWRVRVVRPYRGEAQFAELSAPDGQYPAMAAWRGPYHLDRGSLRAIVAFLCDCVAKSRGRSNVAAFSGEARECLRALHALMPVLRAEDGI